MSFFSLGVGMSDDQTQGNKSEEESSQSTDGGKSAETETEGEE